MGPGNGIETNSPKNVQLSFKKKSPMRNESGPSLIIATP